MEPRTRWQDWVNLVLGVWLFITPFIRVNSVSGSSEWNAFIVGAVIGILAIIGLGSRQIWVESINLIAGLWLIISPFILGFGRELGPTWNNVIVGILVSTASLWALLQQRPIQHERPA